LRLTKFISVIQTQQQETR